MTAPRRSACLLTPPRPGAVAIIQVQGDVVPVLRELCGEPRWPTGRVRLARLGDIDQGLAGRVDEETAQVMPHGGPRVVQRLMARLGELGAAPIHPSALDPCDLYPEAADRIEALTLAALARAASPLAIDLLLGQPQRWRRGEPPDTGMTPRSGRLNRLIEPPSVVLVGPPNVGKSTLCNALAGRGVAISLDAPGTTRDYVWVRLELAGLVAMWHDTPGLRATEDPIETEAVALARRLMLECDLLVAMTDPEHDWPRPPRPADLRVASKADLGPRRDADLSVSATTGDGMPELVRCVRDLLVPPADLAHPGPWLFDAGLLAADAGTQARQPP